MNYVEGAVAHAEYAKWICPTKRAYASVAEARQVAQHRLSVEPTLKALYYYRCPVCRSGHMRAKKTSTLLAKQGARA